MQNSFFEFFSSSYFRFLGLVSLFTKKKKTSYFWDEVTLVMTWFWVLFEMHYSVSNRNGVQQQVVQENNPGPLAQGKEKTIQAHWPPQQWFWSPQMWNEFMIVLAITVFLSSIVGSFVRRIIHIKLYVSFSWFIPCHPKFVYLRAAWLMQHIYALGLKERNGWRKGCSLCNRWSWIHRFMAGYEASATWLHCSNNC